MQNKRLRLHCGLYIYICHDLLYSLLVRSNQSMDNRETHTVVVRTIFDGYYSIILLRTVVLTNIYKCNKSQFDLAYRIVRKNITLMIFFCFSLSRVYYTKRTGIERTQENRSKWRSRGSAGAIAPVRSASFFFVFSLYYCD